VRECHGLLLDDIGQLVAKSWNIPKVCEDLSEVPLGKDAVAEEMPDGGSVIIYNMEGRWHIASDASVDASEYIPGMRMPGFTYANETMRFLLRNNMEWYKPFSNSNPNLCFSCIFVNKYAKTPQPSFADKLYLMAVHNLENAQELHADSVGAMAGRLRLARPRHRKIESLGDLKKMWNGRHALCPGLMVRSHGERYFVSNKIYTAVENALEAGDLITPTHIAKIYQACEDFSELLEVAKIYSGWCDMMAVLRLTKETFWKELIELWRVVKNEDDMRTFAAIVKHHELNPLLFMRKDKKITSFSGELNKMAPQKLVGLARVKFEKEFKMAERLIKFEGGNTTNGGY
jgi:hypothetical protein